MKWVALNVSFFYFLCALLAAKGVFRASLSSLVSRDHYARPPTGRNPKVGRQGHKTVFDVSRFLPPTTHRKPHADSQLTSELKIKVEKLQIDVETRKMADDKAFQELKDRLKEEQDKTSELESQLAKAKKSQSEEIARLENEVGAFILKTSLMHLVTF